MNPGIPAQTQHTAMHPHLHKNPGRHALVAVLLLCTFCMMLLAEPLHADHPCTGESCPVCAVIHAVRQVLGGMDAPVPLHAAATVPFSLISAAAAVQSLLTAALTPVKQKKRLNN
ncbi:MAG: hypothetical protein II187_06475 [Treponema sp.]|nr:hypothetical protein [Treponema sp.]